MEDNIDHYWINVIYEIMTELFNKYSLQFMCVGHNSNSLGGKKQNIWCGLTSILWRSYIVEGKEKPKKCGPKWLLKFGKAVGLILRMCRYIFGYGKALMFNNGFCVVKVLFHFGARGVYSSLIINNRRYFPKNVPVEEVDKLFRTNKLEISTFWKPIRKNEIFFLTYLCNENDDLF